MNDPIQTTNRFAKLRRVVWLPAWVVAAVLLVIASTDTSKAYFMIVPVWLALAPGVLPRLSFIGRSIIYGYIAMLCVAYIRDVNFNFDNFRRDEYFDLLVVGSLASLIVAVSRQGLGPDSPISERIFRTASMTLALFFLILWFCRPDVR